MGERSCSHVKRAFFRDAGRSLKVLFGVAVELQVFIGVRSQVAVGNDSASTGGEVTQPAMHRPTTRVEARIITANSSKAQPAPPISSFKPSTIWFISLAEVSPIFFFRR